MPQTPDIEPISKQLTIVVGLTVVGFMAFGLALSFYRNILFEETLKTIEEQNLEISKEIEQGYRDLEYFRSEQFRDKFAKENLGKAQAGEKVLIVTQKSTPEFLEIENNTAENERKEAAYLELLRQMPIIEHWKLYLFYRDNIEEMKKAL